MRQGSAERSLRDASCGSPFERAAAYRHNRAQRGWLLVMALRRFAAGALALLAVFAIDAGGAAAAPLFAAAAGIGFACAVAAGFTYFVAWAYLAHNDR